MAGETYQVVCNMNVWADVQEAFDGDIIDALQLSGKAALEFCAALINDANDETGRPERVTARQLGRLIAPAEMVGIRSTLMELIKDALSSGEEEEQSDEGDEKNVQATAGH